MGDDLILKLFIKVMEAGIAFSMVIGILLAYYRTKEPRKKNILIISSFILGIIAAIISAIVRSIPHFLNRTSFSFWSMVPLVIALIGLVIAIIFDRKLKEKGESVFENIFSFLLAIYIISSFFYYIPPLFLQLNSFVYYGESAVSTMVLFRVLGYSFGLILMILSGIAIYKVGMKLEKNQLRMILLIVLLLRGITQINVIIQRFYSLGIIPKNRIIFSVIAWIVNNDNIIAFVIMGILAIAPIILWKQNIKIKDSYNNNAELRKIKARMKNRRHWAQFLLILFVINFSTLTIFKAYEGREIALSEPEEYQMEDGMIVIPLTLLDDNHLHRYDYHSSDGVDMRFFAIKKSENSYVAVLDACEICGPSGYYERKDDVLCKLCDVIMNRGTIGFKGGCNPIPFPYVVHEGKIKIQPKDLDAMSYVFK
ncbi:MAG: Fe-S-containing protein [Tissierellia bacterium]|nr:Fe-S-containing protein [Tissierellia bacterium]